MKLLKPTRKQPPHTEPAKYKVRKFGVVEDDDHLIFIQSSVLKKIVEYSRTNLHRELGGVLVGNYCTWENRQYIEIEEYIEAKLGLSKSASFTFTHESWTEIGKTKEQRFSEQPLVGWHHTHPSFGIFLSGMDLFIHKSYFDLPWHVALVVDPVADKLGFFQWKKGEIAKCGFYTVAPADGKAKAAAK